MSEPDTYHLRLLRILEASPEISQRQLAGELGVSLGKTHYLLRALLEKGLVKAVGFRRHGNKLAYLYLLTPAGVSEKLQSRKLITWSTPAVAAFCLAAWTADGLMSVAMT